MTSQGRLERKVMICVRGTMTYWAYPPSKTRPIPPIIVTAWVPGARMPSGSRSMTPEASIPRMRGKVTPSAMPCTEWYSLRLRPKAMTFRRTQPSGGAGTGSSTTWRLLMLPGSLSRAASMVGGVVASIVSGMSAPPGDGWWVPGYLLSILHQSPW